MQQAPRNTGRTSPRRGATLLVPACAFLAILVTATACTARRAPSTRIGDAAVTTKIKAKLAADPQVNPFEVDVDTSKGVVHLRGMVETEADRAEIERIARNTKGVNEVVNEIRLGDPTVGEVVSDTLLETRIKAKLTADPDVNPFRIDVDVVGGVVTLSGEVDDDRTRDEAEDLARSTAGVHRVENRIRLADRKS